MGYRGLLLGLLGCALFTAAHAQPPASPAQMITPERIGPAYAGGSILVFKREVEGYPLVFVEDYAPAYSALCAMAAGEDMICAAIPAKAYAAPFDDVAFLRTTHPRYRTAEGIGPGSTLDEAAAVYGEPRLSYSQDGDLQEYLTFPDGPKGIVFRPARTGTSDGFAGIYRIRDDYMPTTREWHPDAVIEAVDVFGR